MKERTLGKSPSYTRNVELFREACQDFGKILDEYAEGPATAKIQSKHEKRRSAHIEEYGDDSIYTLLPERHDGGHRILSATAGILSRRGVNTKSDLLMLNEERIKQLRYIGEERSRIASAMHDVALAEFHLKWSSDHEEDQDIFKEEIERKPRETSTRKPRKKTGRTGPVTFDIPDLPDSAGARTDEAERNRKDHLELPEGSWRESDLEKYLAYLGNNLDKAFRPDRFPPRIGLGDVWAEQLEQMRRLGERGTQAVRPIYFYPDEEKLAAGGFVNLSPSRTSLDEREMPRDWRPPEGAKVIAEIHSLERLSLTEEFLQTRGRFPFNSIRRLLTSETSLLVLAGQDESQVLFRSSLTPNLSQEQLAQHSGLTRLNERVDSMTSRIRNRRFDYNLEVAQFFDLVLYRGQEKNLERVNV